MLKPNTSGNTPLHWASLNGHLSVVRLLISWIDSLPAPIVLEIKSQHDLIHKQTKQKRKEETEKTATENGEEVPKEEVEEEKEREEREKDEAELRPLWDVPNKAGRGPMSEAQLGGHEELVKWLLEHMVLGGKQGISDERVENEKDTPTPAETTEVEKGGLSEKVEQVKLD